MRNFPEELRQITNRGFLKHLSDDIVGLMMVVTVLMSFGLTIIFGPGLWLLGTGIVLYAYASIRNDIEKARTSRKEVYSSENI